MKINSHTDRNNGCFWYRNKTPLDALKKKGWDTAHVDKGDLVPKDLDCVMFSRGYHPGFEEFVFGLKDRGVKIWYDTDDAMDLVRPWNPFSIPTRSYLGSYYFLLNEADFITTTTPLLAEHLRTKTSKPVRVFPNYLNPVEWKQRVEKPGELRIGFSGSASHIRDLNIVLPVILELQKHYNFTFVVMGLDMGAKDVEDYRNRQMKNWGKFYESHAYGIEVEKLYQTLKQIKHEWIDGVRWEVYSRSLPKLGLDIGICPLEDEPFNRCKTPIKFYEYTITGTPSISSNVSPFKEEALALADNDFGSWYDALEAMIMHEELRKTTLAAQKEYVEKNRFIDDHISDLESILNEFDVKK